MKDTLGRRKRFDPPDPTEEVVRIKDRDLAWFRALQTHGTLPSTYLNAFGGGGHKGTLRRLMELYHDGYVTRPSDQRRSDRAKYQPISYQLGEKGWRILERRHLVNTYTASFRGHTLHQFMVSCLTASIHLACQKHGVTYLSQEDILSDARCTRKELSLPYNGSIIKPDQLFGIKYADDKVRFFAVEAERAEKNMTRYEEKLRPYDAIIQSRIFRSEWGIPNMRVLVFTATPSRTRKMMEPLDGLLNPENFLFRHKDYFEEQWHVPPVMTDLLEEPWTTTTGDFDISRA
jgi:hypothetical protein